MYGLCWLYISSKFHSFKKIFFIFKLQTGAGLFVLTEWCKEARLWHRICLSVCIAVDVNFFRMFKLKLKECNLSGPSKPLWYLKEGYKWILGVLCVPSNTILYVADILILWQAHSYSLTKNNLQSSTFSVPHLNTWKSEASVSHGLSLCCPLSITMLDRKPDIDHWKGQLQLKQRENKNSDSSLQ